MNPFRHFFQRFFSKAPLETSLSDALYPLCKTVQFNEGDVIFEQGEAVKAFFWVQDGDVELRHAGSTLKLLHFLDMFGEDAVFDEAKAYDYAAIALTDVTLIQVDAQGFMALVEQHPHLGFRLLEAVSQHVHRHLASTAEPQQDAAPVIGIMDFIPNTFLPKMPAAKNNAPNKLTSLMTQPFQFFASFE